MQLIDTHCHLYVPEFDDDRDEVIARARAAGVAKLLLPDMDSASRGRMEELCRHYPEYCLPMIGLHPTSVNDNPRWREELDRVEEQLGNSPDGGFCAVGEIGLDFYWSDVFREQQVEVFSRQLRLSLRCGLPVAIHTRAAWTEMVQTIGSYEGSGLKGVFHAFSEDADTYRRLKSCGVFLFGIGGMVTFKKSSLADTVREMELADIVLETDCPYLTPVPHRGRRNEPAYLLHICEKVAELKGVSPARIAAATTANAWRMFGLSNDNQLTTTI